MLAAPNTGQHLMKLASGHPHFSHSKRFKLLCMSARRHRAILAGDPCNPKRLQNSSLRSEALRVTVRQAKLRKILLLLHLTADSDLLMLLRG